MCSSVCGVEIELDIIFKVMFTQPMFDLIIYAIEFETVFKFLLHNPSYRCKQGSLGRVEGRQIFEKLSNKNAIKPQIVDNHGFLLEI